MITHTEGRKDMTKTFTYTFKVMTRKEGTEGRKESDWFWKEVTLTKKVTDRMEERNNWKAGYAANWFNEVMRKEYGFKKATVTACGLKEIKKGEAK